MSITQQQFALVRPLRQRVIHKVEYKNPFPSDIEELAYVIDRIAPSELVDNKEFRDKIVSEYRSELNCLETLAQVDALGITKITIITRTAENILEYEVVMSIPSCTLTTHGNQVVQVPGLNTTKGYQSNQILKHVSAAVMKTHKMNTIDDLAKVAVDTVDSMTTAEKAVMMKLVTESDSGLNQQQAGEVNVEQQVKLQRSCVKYNVTYLWEIGAVTTNIGHLSTASKAVLSSMLGSMIALAAANGAAEPAKKGENLASSLASALTELVASEYLDEGNLIIRTNKSGIKKAGFAVAVYLSGDDDAIKALQDAADTNKKRATLRLAINAATALNASQAETNAMNQQFSLHPLVTLTVLLLCCTKQDIRTAQLILAMGIRMNGKGKEKSLLVFNDLSKKFTEFNGIGVCVSDTASLNSHPFVITFGRIGAMGAMCGGASVAQVFKTIKINDSSIMLLKAIDDAETGENVVGERQSYHQLHQALIGSLSQFSFVVGKVGNALNVTIA